MNLIYWILLIVLLASAVYYAVFMPNNGECKVGIVKGADLKPGIDIGCGNTTNGG